MVHPTGKSPSQVFTNLFIPDGTPEQHPWWNELERLTVSPENAARTLEALYNVVVSALAGQVHTPTLVMHSRGDARVPFDEGRKLAAMIPGARFVPPESRNHVLLENEAAWPAWTTAPSPGSCGRARRPCATRCRASSTSSACARAPRRSCMCATAKRGLDGSQQAGAVGAGRHPAVVGAQVP